MCSSDLIDRDAKLDTLLDIMEKMMYILDKILDRHEVDIDVDYLEQLMPFPDQTQTQPLQDIYNKKNMYNEQDHRGNNEEGCQESPDSLPLSCIVLLRELYNQASNINKEQCPEETISHLELTKSEIGEETTQPESLPLCYNSFQIINFRLLKKNGILTIY